MDIAETEPTTVHYAGFWRRFNAYGIDASIVIIIAWLIDAYLLGGHTAATATATDMVSLGGQAAEIQQMLAALQNGVIDPAMLEKAKSSLVDSTFGGSILGVNLSAMVLVSAVYNILFVAGPWRATPGKHWLGMKVVLANGEALTLMQSTLRHILSGISMLPFGWGLGCLTIAFTKYKTAPHDMLCNTRVIRTDWRPWPMFSWLKRLISAIALRKKRDAIEPYYAPDYADKSNMLPLDPENDPWGRR